MDDAKIRKNIIAVKSNFSYSIALSLLCVVFLGIELEHHL